MANTPTTDLTGGQTLYADGTTGWTELSSYSSGASPSSETEAFLQGTDCVSQQVSANKTGAASGLNYAVADPTGFVDGTDVFFFWWLFLFPGAINAYNETVGQTAPSQNSPGTASGFFIGIGSSTTNHDWYAVGGSDYGRYPYGGWQNAAIDPGQSASFTDGPPAASTYSNFGFLPNIASAPSRGQSLVVDAIRYGRGLIQYTGGSPAGTFDDIADTNDTVANRWGLFQRASGSFLWKGKLELGTTASSLLFTAQNRTINIDDTRQVYTNFNVLEINNSASVITFNNITINKLRYIDTLSFDNSKGNFLVNDGATVSLDGCTFGDMNTFVFGANTTVVSTSFLRCAQVTQGSATITSCDFINGTGTISLSVNSLTDVQTCSFTSDGSNHAVEFTGTVPSEYTWNHTSSGYLAGSLGDFTTGTNVNATLYINPSATSTTDLILNIPTGITVPSIRFGANYSGTVTIRNAPKTIDVNVKDEDGVNVSGAFVWLNDGVITIFNGTTDASGNIPQQSYVGSNNTTLRVRRFGDLPFETTLGTATGSVSQLVTLINDRQQVAVPTLNNTWTIDTSAQTITMTSGPTLPFSAYSAIDTSQDLYEFAMNTFAATAFMQFPEPIQSITRVQYEFINGYTFGAKDNDHKFLYDGSYFDNANSLLWSNVKTIGSVETGTGIYIVQGVEASDAALTSWWPDGNIDVLVKVEDGTFIQSTDDTATNVDGGVWLFAREYGDLYDHFFADLSNGGQNIVALSTLPDLNNETASGTVAGYTNVTTTFGATSQDIGDGNGNQPYSVIVDCSGRTLKEVYERTKYITSFDFSQTVNGDDGYEYRNANEANFSNVDNKQSPFGTFAGGRFFGAQGVWLTNIAAADITNYQLIDNNGVARFPPLQVTFSLTGLQDGTEIRIYQTSDTSDVAGVEDITNGTGTSPTTGVTTLGSTNDNTFVYTYTYASDINVFVVIFNLNFQSLRLSNIILNDESTSIPITQVIDRQYFNP